MELLVGLLIICVGLVTTRPREVEAPVIERTPGKPALHPELLAARDLIIRHGWQDWAGSSGGYCILEAVVVALCLHRDEWRYLPHMRPDLYLAIERRTLVHVVTWNDQYADKGMVLDVLERAAYDI